MDVSHAASLSNVALLILLFTIFLYINKNSNSVQSFFFFFFPYLSLKILCVRAAVQGQLAVRWELEGFFLTCTQTASLRQPVIIQADVITGHSCLLLAIKLASQFSIIFLLRCPSLYVILFFLPTATDSLLYYFCLVLTEFLIISSNK